MPIMGGLILGGMSLVGSLVGDATSASSTASTNAQSLANQQQLEGWEQQMSDTSIQRRVTDLEAAGLNPALAVGQGGASSPGMSPVNLSPPGAAFGNLGNQVSNAVQAGTGAASTVSQLGLNTAQAANQNAQAANAMANALKTAGVDTDAVGQSMRESVTRQLLLSAQTGAANASANLSNEQARVAQETIPKIQQEISTLASSQDLNQARAVMTDLQNDLQGMTNAQFQAMSPALISTAINAAQASGLDLVQLQKEASMNATKFGTALPYLNSIFNWFHLGANLSSSTSTTYKGK